MYVNASTWKPEFDDTVTANHPHNGTKPKRKKLPFLAISSQFGNLIFPPLFFCFDSGRVIIIPDSAFGSFRQLSERDIEINSANAPRFNTIPWRPGESSGQVAPGRFPDLLLLFFFLRPTVSGFWKAFQSD